MFEKLAIIDMTKNYPGTDLDVVGRLGKLGPMYGIGQGQLAVIVRADQSYLREKIGSVWKWVEDPPGGAATAVTSLLTELARSATDLEVLVVSYAGDVLRIAFHPWSPRLRVNSISLRSLREGGISSPMAVAPPRTTGWPFEQVIPLAEAKQLLVRALSSNPVRKTGLRTILENLDARCTKKLDEPPGFISLLVSAAEAENLIEVVGVPPNPTVHLKSVTAESQDAPPMVQYPATTGNSNLMLPPVLSVPEVVAAEPPKKYRSREMGGFLDKIGMPPFADARPQFFEALRKVEETQLGDSYADFLQDAAEEAMEKVTVPNQPWPRIIECLGTYLTAAEAVLGEGEKPLRGGLAGLFEPVRGLAKDLEVRVDALLLLKLSTAFEVSARTLDDCSRALYHKPTLENRKKIVLAAKYLLDKGRVVESTESGTVVYKPVAIAGQVDATGRQFRLTGNVG